jgi:uncharacterized protein YggL (DUF469 family)
VLCFQHQSNPLIAVENLSGDSRTEHWKHGPNTLHIDAEQFKTLTFSLERKLTSLLSEHGEAMRNFGDDEKTIAEPNRMRLAGGDATRFTLWVLALL